MVAAIICEYNPFHNGHKFQLDTVKKDADAVICIMSGSFVQRGAPAIYDKWTRAEDAITNGADLVIELPVVYSAQSAQRFATGGVKLADSLGVVDALYFGSECGDIEKLKNCADILNSEEFNSLIEKEMKEGTSFPVARTNVLKAHYPHIDEALISNPNNILAIEYINALENIKSKIKPHTHKRNFDFVSASAIREQMENGEDVSAFVPAQVRKTYDKGIFDALVLHHFRKERLEALQIICDMNEGLENKFKKASQSAISADELAESVKSKRYTRTRIDRVIVNSLLEIEEKHTEIPPQYIRVLAFNERGKSLLSYIKKKSSLPIITKVADAKPDSPDYEVMFEKDLLATDIYSTLTNKKAGLDFLTSPIYKK